jgi:hypothetical protein
LTYRSQDEREVKGCGGIVFTITEAGVAEIEHKAEHNEGSKAEEWETALRADNSEKG